jgi:hypothetical protein
MEENNSNTNQFAQKWRKQQACERCRRFKVRCQYQSPEDVSCTRCSKANAQCVVASTDGSTSTKKRHKSNLHTGGSPPSAAPTSPTLCIECHVKQVRPINSEDERVERLALLRMWIGEAEEEMRMLETLDMSADRGIQATHQLKYMQQRARRQTHGSIASPGFTTDQIRANPEPTMSTVVVAPKVTQSWMELTIKSKDYIAASYEYGLYSPEEARQCFEMYREDMSYFLPFPINEHPSFDEARKMMPLLTLAAITCAAVGSTLDRAKERSQFLERVTDETIFIEGNLNLEVLMTVIMMTVFVTPKTDRRAPFQLLVALSIALSLDLGSDEDLLILEDPTSEPQQVQMAFRRVRCYISVCTCIAGMAVNSARCRLMQLLSHCDRCCEALLLRSPDFKPMVCVLRMMLLFHESIEKLRDNYEPFSSAMALYESSVARLEQLYSQCESICAPWVGRPFLIHIASTFHILIQSMNECMMNRLAMFETAEPQFVRLRYRFAEEIKKYACIIIDAFVEITSGSTRFPTFMFFRPLHALTALMRLRLLSWSMHLQVEIDVEGAFVRVKKAWDDVKRRSYAAGVLYELLMKVEMWLNVKMSRLAQPVKFEDTTSTTDSGDTAPRGLGQMNRGSTETLHRIIREVIINRDESNLMKRKRVSVSGSGAVSMHSSNAGSARDTPGIAEQSQMPLTNLSHGTPSLPSSSPSTIGANVPPIVVGDYSAKMELPGGPFQAASAFMEPPLMGTIFSDSGAAYGGCADDIEGLLKELFNDANSSAAF